MAKRIEKLCLDHFRGATCPVEIEFDISKPAVMIFGENGTGKSTIVDAVDFMCNENVGSISERSSTKSSHLSSLNSQPSDVKVTMTSNGDTWTGSLGGRSPNVTGPKNRPNARILRRSQILNLVNAEPRDRYKEIQDFVELPGILKCENALRESKRSVEQDLNTSAQAQAQAIEALENFWKEEGSKEKDCIAWAQKESQKDSNNLDSATQKLSKILAAISNAIAIRSRLNTSLQQHQTAETVRKLAEDALQEAISKQTDPGISSSLINVLEDTKKFLEEIKSVIKCPVCENTVQYENLKKKVEERLASLNEIVKLKQGLDSAKKDTAAKVAIVRQLQKDLLVSMQGLAEVIKDSGIEQIEKLAIEWTSFGKSSDDMDKLSQNENILILAHNALDIIVMCEDSLKTCHQDTQKTLTQLNSVKRHLQTVQDKTEIALKLSGISKQLGKMLEIVESTRKQYVEGVLANISGSVQELYAKVHPNENIGNVRFYLDPRYQGSLLFDGSFQGVDQIPPQAYYSESHLDTLGVCIFLALAKYFNTGSTIVVLDDVVTSIDQAHMDRFMNLLHEEAANFNQLIIATHYRPWRDRYRYARGPAGNIQLIELLHWSLPRGVRHTKTRLSVEELQHYAQQEPMDRQIVSSKAGILLESLLDHIALMYECKIPRKADPFYTLGELTDSIGKKLRKALKSEYMSDDFSSVENEKQLEPIITKIAEMSWIRNQVGCHWNLSGLDVSDSDIQQFSTTTIELANALICENCGQLPLKEISGSYFECRCHRKRLHPINNPD